jgi:hypothetical protein
MNTIGFMPFKITEKDILLIAIIITVKTVKRRKARGLLARKIATINNVAAIILVLGSSL